MMMRMDVIEGSCSSQRLCQKMSDGLTSLGISHAHEYLQLVLDPSGLDPTRNNHKLDCAITALVAHKRICARIGLFWLIEPRIQVAVGARKVCNNIIPSIGISPAQSTGVRSAEKRM